MMQDPSQKIPLLKRPFREEPSRPFLHEKTSHHQRAKRQAAPCDRCRTKKASAKQIVSQVKGAHIISVVSGSGGTGKSAIATMGALLAQKRGIKTLLLDADFQFGDLKYLLGYKETLEVGDILTHPEQIETLLKQDSWPALLSAPAKISNTQKLPKSASENCLPTLSRIST